MSFESVAMSCLVTSPAIFLPSRGLRKRRRWLATFSQLSIRGRISPSGFLTGVFIQSIRSSMAAVGETVLAYGTVVKLGRRISTADVRLTNNNQVLLASGRGAYLA